MTFFSTSERLEIGNVPFVSNHAKPTRSEALEYYRRVAKDNLIKIHLFEKVLDVKTTDHQHKPGGKKKIETPVPLQQGMYHVITTKSEYTAQFIIIATGLYDIPYLLNVPGESLPKVKHYYDDPH